MKGKLSISFGLRFLFHTNDSFISKTWLNAGKRQWPTYSMHERLKQQQQRVQTQQKRKNQTEQQEKGWRTRRLNPKQGRKWNSGLNSDCDRVSPEGLLVPASDHECWKAELHVFNEEVKRKYTDGFVESIHLNVIDRLGNALTLLQLGRAEELVLAVECRKSRR